jgi:hypothetical protein
MEAVPMLIDLYILLALVLGAEASDDDGGES